MLAASVYIVYISQLLRVYAIQGHVLNADTLWKELRWWHTGYYNKPTLCLGGNHCSKMSTVDISQIINPFPFYVDLFSFQNHWQDFNQTWVLVVSLLLVFSVFCVLFFLDHCIVCPMCPVSMNCPFCCFLRFIFINYTSEWEIVDYHHISNCNLYYCENQLHSIRWYWC
jgi:hypothetical protein